MRPSHPRAPGPAPRSFGGDRAHAARAPLARGTVRVSEGAAAAIVRGHPWVFRDALVAGAVGAAGDPVIVESPSGAFLAHALSDPASPIAARVLSREPRARVDEELLSRRLAAALGRRAALLADPDTDAIRLCHGEGDRIPGLVVDRYGPWAIVRLDGALLDAWLPRLADALLAALAPLGVRGLARRLSRDEGEGRADRTEALAGEAVPAEVVVREHGMRMVVDLAQGQKTGAFLDQRENRHRVRGLASGKRVLNLFSYAGGFSVAAMLGGAMHVTSVDLASAAHRTAQRSCKENGLDPAAHAWITADAFAFLDGARARGETWDLVVSDPPSFAPSEKAKPRALASYRRLHAACAAVLAPGGTFCASSCSSHVWPDDFLATLDDASLGRDDLSVVASHGAGEDHPVLAAFPEGRYLKFVVLR